MDSVPRFLTVDPQEISKLGNIPSVEYFLAEKKALEAKKLEIDILRERTILEAKQEAQNIIGEAQQEADNLVKKAQDQQREIIEQFRQVGWQEGREEGLQQIHSEATGYLQEAQLALGKAEEERQKIIQGTEEEIVLLALDIAKKIIKKEIELGSSVIREITQQAIKKATHREKVIIRVNAIDLEYVEKERGILREKSGSSDLIILPDPTVEPGGCVLETDLGTVDARIDTQLTQIREVLLKIVQEKEDKDDKFD